MVDCSVGLHDTEMGPARLSAVTPAAIDVAVGSGASKKQGRGTRPTSQTQRAEDRIASRARPGVPDRSFCTRGGIPSVIKLVPNKHRNAGGRISGPAARARARHESRNTCEYTDVGSTHRASCDARVALKSGPRSDSLSLSRLGYATESATTPCNTVHAPDMRWPMLIWEQSLGHAWHGFAHAPLTWHRTPPPPDCRTHERHVDTHTVTPR